MVAVKLTKSSVSSVVPQCTDYIVWDSELRGFGLKVSKGGRKSYICQYRTPGGRSGTTRRMTIGAHGSPWSPEQAREEARRVLARAAIGSDPAREKQAIKSRISVKALCDQYVEHGCATKKLSTLATDIGRIERHIKPLLGHRFVQDITRADVKRFLHDVAVGRTRANFKTKARGCACVRGGKGTATRTVGLLGGIFSYAVDCGLIDVSPVRGVKRFPDNRGYRYLSQRELVALGNALRDEEVSDGNRKSIAIIKLLVFTGARKGEIEGLRWSEVDFDTGCLKLADSKTGAKVIPLNAGALQILSEQNRGQGDNHVFPASRGDGFWEGTPKVWRLVRARAGLNDVRLHDLRHSFASIAVSAGASLPIIGALLGHKDSATTQRYAHLSDDPLRAASDAVGRQIAAALSSEGTGRVFEIGRTRVRAGGPRNIPVPRLD
ncbi:MAG: tyrosine-type recombinase/integrase [Aestuariivirga sp.]